MTRKQCEQYKCTLRGMPSLCPVCKECGAPACVIDSNCANCHCCENDEGFIRQGTPKGYNTCDVEISIEQVNK